MLLRCVSDEVSQGAYLDERLDVRTGMAVQRVGRRIFYYIPSFARSLGDRDHFFNGGERLP